ncbi:MAG: radical SAM protein [Candidatus Omnitrophota bacterium]
MRPRNNAAMGLGALKANLLGTKTPLSVMLSVTNSCNSKCSYCDIPLRKQREMSTEEIIKLIDEMSAAGVQKLSLWGGEPLLRKDIGRIIGRAKEKGMYVNCDSNGYLVPQKFEEIKDLDFLILSFDGEKTYHDQNREPGSFDKFIRAVEHVNNRISVWTLTVLTKHNINSVDFIVEKAKEHGFKTMFQVPYHPQGIGAPASLFATAEEYRRTFRRLIEMKKDGAPIISSQHYLRVVADWPFFPDTTNEERKRGIPKCWAGKLFCNIDTNGDMYPCSPMIDRVKPLNCLELCFEESFRRLSSLSCRACVSACCVEANLVFSFDLLTIQEWFKATQERQ